MKKVILIICCCFLGLQNFAQENYIPSQENMDARQWFEDAKFGLFIHWGVYSVLGDGEWVMHHQNIAIEAYEKLPSFFNPIEYNADEWVLMAKNAGMQYITITSRHHDGFSMFSTKATNYNIVEKTPYKKDIIKELALACKRHNMKLFFYYSLLDWHDDNYFPRGKTGQKIPGRKEGKWEDYIAFMKTQLTELLTNYGEIAGIWFDGKWDKKDADWYFDDIYKLIHDLQPQCLIGNNHHESVISGEDFQMFEKDLPGKSTQAFASKREDIGNLPKEVCETINGSWGFKLNDNSHKTKKTLVQYLVKAAGFGSNLLLNVGPMPNGKIQPEHVQSLMEIGQWLYKNGETIYKTRAGHIVPTDDWVSTKKGNTLYLHVLNSDLNELHIQDFNEKIKSVAFYASKNKADFKKQKTDLFITLPNDEKNDIDCIIEITFKQNDKV